MPNLKVSLNILYTYQTSFTLFVSPFKNLLFTTHESGASLKLIDFGFARVFGNDELTTPCYTLDYAAPEILQGRNYDESCDLWSIGVIMYAMLSGHAPFHASCSNRSVAELTKRITDGKFSFEQKEWKDVSDAAKDLIKGKNCFLKSTQSSVYSFFMYRTSYNRAWEKIDHGTNPSAQLVL